MSNVVTETHVQPGDRDDMGRMGRLIAFMAAASDGRPAAYGVVRGIAVSASTAVLVDTRGRGVVVGTGDAGRTDRKAYFLTAPNDRPYREEGQPLGWPGVSVVKGERGSWFNLNSWTGAGRLYRISVSQGRFSVEGNSDVY